MRTHTRRSARAAFTLIELLMSMAMGLAIIFVAVAAFRTAMQAVSLTNRQSLENRMLVVGVRQALDDIDFWLSLDRPGYMPLRTGPNAPTSARGALKAIQPRAGGYDRAG